VFPSCVVRNDGDNNTYNTSVNVSLEWPLDVETKNEVLTEVSRVSTAVVALISPSAGMQLMRLQFALYGFCNAAYGEPLGWVEHPLQVPLGEGPTRFCFSRRQS
jgi:hypothetical protein